MFHATIHVLLYALLAGLSALSFAAAIAVMRAGRVRALGFAGAFVVAQALTCSLFVIVGVAVTGASENSHAGLQATLELMLAAALFLLALRIRGRPSSERSGSGERTRALLDRLDHLHFLTTLLAGFLLGIGGPKRLLLTALAATAITTAGVRDSNEAALVVCYTAVATVLVWGPVILFVLLAERGVALLQRAQDGLAHHQPQVKVYALMLLATVLLLDAFALLLF